MHSQGNQAPAASRRDSEALALRSQKSNTELLRRLFKFVTPNEKRTLGAACVAMTFTSLTNLAFPKLVAWLVDGMAKQEPPRRRFLCSALLLFGAGAIGSWLRTYLFAIVNESISTRLRVALVQHILAQDMAFFDKTNTQDLIQRVADDAQITASATTANLAKAYRYLNSALGGSVLLCLLSPRLTLVTLGVVPMVGISGMVYGRRARGLSKLLKEEVAKVTVNLEQVLSNIRTVRHFAMDEQEAHRFGSALEHTATHVHTAAHAEGVFMGGLMFGGYGSLLGVLSYGSVLVSRGHLSIGALTSFALYSATVGLGFSGLSQVYSETSKALSSAQRVFEVLDANPTLHQDAGEQLATVKGSLDLVNVHFHYPTRPEVAVLRGLTLRIAAGEVLALAGASGSGKSTIAALLTRLYEVTSGEILLDGRKLHTLSASWLRRQIAVVSQDPVLFSTSILENILYAEGADHGLQGAHQDASMHGGGRRARAEAAAQEANAADFIWKMPEGFDTPVGERGIQLSGGQRQRVAIARALVCDPRILILDEATSALDGASEHLVREALERLMRGRTTLVIAHRTSTLSRSERVAVVADGVIVQDGAYSELLKAQGGLSRLVETLPA